MRGSLQLCRAAATEAPPAGIPGFKHLLECEMLPIIDNTVSSCSHAIL